MVLLKEGKYKCNTNINVTHYLSIWKIQSNTGIWNGVLFMVILDYDLSLKTDSDILTTGWPKTSKELQIKMISRQTLKFTTAQENFKIQVISRLQIFCHCTSFFPGTWRSFNKFNSNPDLDFNGFHHKNSWEKLQVCLTDEFIIQETLTTNLRFKLIILNSELGSNSDIFFKKRIKSPWNFWVCTLSLWTQSHFHLGLLSSWSEQSGT